MALTSGIDAALAADVASAKPATKLDNFMLGVSCGVRTRRDSKMLFGSTRDRSGSGETVKGRLTVSGGWKLLK